MGTQDGPRDEWRTTSPSDRFAALAAPDNDDRADATPVTAIPFSDVVDVTDATVEDDEPAPSCAPTGQTVWYEVQLAQRSQLVVDTRGSGFDTVAAVYTPDLEEVACNDDAGDLQARVGFTAERGATYLVQVGAYGGYLDTEYEDPTLVVTIERGRVTTRRISQERYSFRGLQANAFDWSESEDGSSSRSEGVFIVQGRASDSWSRGQYRVEEVTVGSFEQSYNAEKDTVTFVDWWGWAPLENGDIDRRLEGAYVDQDVWITGYRCTGPVIDWEEVDEDDEFEFDCTELGEGEVRVAVDWTGYGPTRTSMGRDRDSDEWGTWSFRYRARERQAHVTGGVTGDLLSFDLTGAEGLLSDVSDSFSFRPARR